MKIGNLRFLAAAAALLMSFSAQAGSCATGVSQSELNKAMLWRIAICTAQPGSTLCGWAAGHESFLWNMEAECIFPD